MNEAFGSLSFLFNNYFIYYSQKPVFFPHCNLLIGFPPNHWSPTVLKGWVIQETGEFRSHSYSCWHSKPLHPPHAAQPFSGTRSCSRCHLTCGTMLSFPVHFTAFIPNVGKRNPGDEKLKFFHANTTFLFWNISSVTLDFTTAIHSVEMQSSCIPIRPQVYLQRKRICFLYGLCSTTV